MKEAADLAYNIRSSASCYHFSDFLLPNTDVKERILRGEELGCYILLDAETGQGIRASHEISVDDGGRAGVKLCTIRPALVRRRKDSAETMTLIKATILVKFDRPLIRVRKSKPEGQVWLETLLVRY